MGRKHILRAGWTLIEQFEPIGIEGRFRDRVLDRSTLPFSLNIRETILTNRRLGIAASMNFVGRDE